MSSPIPNNTAYANLQRDRNLAIARRAEEDREYARQEERERRRRDENTPVGDVINYLKNLNIDELQSGLYNGNIGKHWLMMIVGLHLERERPNGWSCDDFTALVLRILDGLNIWTKRPNTEDYDFSASIRSLLFEMSPSSMQHYFKYGKCHSSGLNTPICFVNKELANKNNEYAWTKVDGAGTGRNVKEVKRSWHFVGNLDKETWNIELYGPLPSVEQLREASEGRAVGDRAWGNV
jgi:hypothetical protein